MTAGGSEGDTLTALCSGAVLPRYSPGGGPRMMIANIPNMTQSISASQSLR